MPDILIVDDSEFDREFAAEILMTAMDRRCVFAHNGVAALERIRERPFDLVVTDMQMPRMGGLELLRVLQQEFPQLPVIVVTSRGNEETAVEALQCGASSYIPKRQLRNRLAETVDEVLRSSQSNRMLESLLENRRSEEITLELQNNCDFVGGTVRLLVDGAEKFGIVQGSEIVRVSVALEEAIVNAIIHGNLEVSSELRERPDDAFENLVRLRRNTQPYCDRRVTITADYRHDEVRFCIKDEGPGFDVDSLPDPTDSENILKCSGRGIMLMRAFMDEVTFSDQGSQIRMVKYASSCSIENNSSTAIAG
ncbi:ATP-binding response regulator [Thalassoroseus pseudoceratinae]|uniref:ATP-binding response regulator n=1 Tax=Thalassoroseus pseudoceratinae TaxID=2713176 RepID=UPI00141F1EC5|nr:response regulator [Thalassoroseus pseudoceratinae]